MGVKIQKYITALKTISDGRYHYWDGRPMGIGCSDFTKTALQMAGIIKATDTFHAASGNEGILSNGYIFYKIPWDKAKNSLQEGDILWSHGHHVATWDGKNGVYEAAPIGHGLCDNGKTSVGHYPNHTIRNCGTGTYEWSWIYRIIDNDTKQDTTKRNASSIVKTAYDTVMGKYGKVYYRRDNNPTQYSWEYNVGKYHNGIWSFDCLGFVHTMVNGFCGDTSKLGGGAVMDNFVLMSDEATTLYTYCSVRGTFPKTDIKPGSLLQKSDHVGLYIGEMTVNGQVINTAEDTTAMGGGGKFSWVDVNNGTRYTCKGGAPLPSWTAWGQFDRVNYDTEKAPDGKDEGSKEQGKTTELKVGMKGFDLTYHQGEVNFAKVKAAGYDFIIPRDGWGVDSDGKQTDPALVKNVQAAQAAGLMVPGVYHFIYGINEEEARRNAQNAMANVKKAGLPNSTIIWCDLEYDTVDNARDYRKVVLTPAMQRAMAEAFCKECMKNGYPTGIYLNTDYIVNVYGRDILSKYDIWLADLVGGPDFPCVFQQCNWHGRPDGTTQDVDICQYYGQYPTGTAKYTGKSSESQETPDDDKKEPVVPTPDKATVRNYLGKCMTVITKGKYGETVKALQKMLKNAGFYAGYIDGEAGYYTDKAIRAFQSANGLAVDGSFGPLSWAKMMEKYPGHFVQNIPYVASGKKGETVKTLQMVLKYLGHYTDAIDGMAGPNTVKAIKDYQTKHGLAVDGSFGPLSWTSLIK